MFDRLCDGADPARPLTPLAKDGLAGWLEAQTPALRAWVTGLGYDAAPGSVCVLPGEDGAPGGALAGIGNDTPLWDWAALPDKLPAGAWRLEADLAPRDAERAALGWLLGTYRFERYKKGEPPTTRLVRPEGADRAAVARIAEAIFLVRDLVNTPASDMGPSDLAASARRVAERFGAACTVISGEELLAANYPAVHAVGKGSARPPCLIDIVWGNPAHPKLTLVGKGVCFDSGGLDIKPASAMKLMKKDMAGAAHALALGQILMDVGIKARLRILIPAVENSVGGAAMRPLDVVPTRKGLTVEIGNTDAEGRVILADALAEAAAESPALIVDFATLTGAARVALGIDLPALFCNDDGFAAQLLAAGTAEDDPLWRLPLWKPYRKMMDSKVADISNDSDSPYAGAITAALFLAEFAGSGPWAHLDFMAWNLSSRPGRPEGAEAMALRALAAALARRFASGT